MRLLILAAAIVVSVPLILGFFGRLHPALDSLAHFRAHLAILLGLFALPLVMGPLWLNGVVALGLAIAAFATTYGATSSISSAQASDNASGAPIYRLLQLNVHPRNQTPDEVIALIRRTNPDFLALQEVAGQWPEKLDAIREAYPYDIRCQSGSAAFFSRHPLVGGTQAECKANGDLAVATLDLDGRRLDVGSIHLKWPWPKRQPAQIEAMAPDLAVIGPTAILAGDLNATPWSKAAIDVAASSGMTRVERVGPTWIFRAWPRFLVRFGLPIDQVMSKGAVRVKSARTLESVGSDHLPTLIEFSIDARS